MDQLFKKNKFKLISILFLAFLFLTPKNLQPKLVYSAGCDQTNCGDGTDISYCAFDYCKGCGFCTGYGVPPATPAIPGEKPLGKFEGLGPLGTFINALSSQDVSTPLSLLNKVISTLIGLISAIAFIYFIVVFFTSALSWVSSGGDPKSIEKAQKQISTAIIGLIVVVAAIFIIQILGDLIGINILNPLGFIKDIWI